jgi:hypothetical protein
MNPAGSVRNMRAKYTWPTGLHFMSCSPSRGKVPACLGLPSARVRPNPQSFAGRSISIAVISRQTDRLGPTMAGVTTHRMSDLFRGAAAIGL